MQVEPCRLCHRPIRMMCQTGTGYCSQNCEDSLWARNHTALLDEYAKGLVNCEDSLWARNHTALLDEYAKGLVVRHAV